MNGKHERHAAIRSIIGAGEGATQKHIKRLLAERGIEVSQATLSRDLREIGVVRAPSENGGSSYRLSGGDSGAFMSADITGAAREFMMGKDIIGNFLVIRTKPGNARDFCLVLDRQRWGEIVGTLAGDDTILVIARTAGDAETVAGRLE